MIKQFRNQHHVIEIEKCNQQSHLQHFPLKHRYPKHREFTVQIRRRKYRNQQENNDENNVDVDSFAFHLTNVEIFCKRKPPENFQTVFYWMKDKLNYLINPLFFSKGLISGSFPVKSLKALFKSTEFPTERMY